MKYLHSFGKKCPFSDGKSDATKNAHESSLKLVVEVFNGEIRFQHVVNYGEPCIPMKKYD